MNVQVGTEMHEVTSACCVCNRRHRPLDFLAAETNLGLGDMTPQVRNLQPCPRASAGPCPVLHTTLAWEQTGEHRDAWLQKKGMPPPAPGVRQGVRRLCSPAQQTKCPSIASTARPGCHSAVASCLQPGSPGLSFLVCLPSPQSLPFLSISS